MPLRLWFLIAAGLPPDVMRCAIVARMMPVNGGRRMVASVWGTVVWLAGSEHHLLGKGIVSIVNRIDQRCYQKFQNYWDDTLFRQAILDPLQPDMQVLDMGAGAGIVSQMNFRGLARKVCGVDPDSRVSQNPYLDEGKQGVGEAIPYPDESFDLVFADNVLEHLETPQVVFGEVARQHMELYGKALHDKHMVP